jgi:hypothetical protein
MLHKWCGAQTPGRAKGFNRVLAFEVRTHTCHDYMKNYFAARRCAHTTSRRSKFLIPLITRAPSLFRSNFAMTSSPPATPPAEPPHDPELWRFDDTGATCEWAEEYCPGGFHPVNLGDTFHGGKYRVIRKLGDGSYCTMWLAVSTG